MSIQRMRRRFATHLRILIWVFAPLITLGLLITFNPGMLRTGREDRDRLAGGQEPIAHIGDAVLTRARFEAAFGRTLGRVLPFYTAMGRSVDLGSLWQMRFDALQEAIEEALLLSEARAQGISVSRREVRRKAEEMADGEIAGLKGQRETEEVERLFGQIVSAAEGRPRERLAERRFRRWLVDRLLQEHREGIEEAVIIEKLRQRAVGPVTVTEQDLLESYDRVTVRQLIVSFAPEGREGRTEQEALARAQELLARAREGADFAGLVGAESEAPGPGLQEDLRRGVMPPEWEAAVFALTPGEISEPIRMEEGYALVQMVRRARELPEGFEENKAQLLESLRRQRESELWERYKWGLRERTRIEVVDAELLGYQALMEGRHEEALAKFREAAPGAAARGAGTAAMLYTLASMLRERGGLEEAVNAYEAAADALSTRAAAGPLGEAGPLFLPGARAEALLGLAETHEQLGEVQDALLWYQAASDSADDPMLHERILAAYQRLGAEELAAREQQWLESYREEEAERQRAMEEQRRLWEEQQREQEPAAEP